VLAAKAVDASNDLEVEAFRAWLLECAVDVANALGASVCSLHNAVESCEREKLISKTIASAKKAHKKGRDAKADSGRAAGAAAACLIGERVRWAGPSVVFLDHVALFAKEIRTSGCEWLVLAPEWCAGDFETKRFCVEIRTLQRIVAANGRKAPGGRVEWIARLDASGAYGHYLALNLGGGAKRGYRLRSGTPEPYELREALHATIPRPDIGAPNGTTSLTA